MKKALIIVLMIALLAILAVGASASIQVSDVTIGSSKQVRANDVSMTFKVKNNGTANLTNVQISSDADSKYNVRFTPSTFNITAGAEQQITVKADIPFDHPAVESDSSASDFLNEKAFDIADIFVNDGTTTYTANLNMQAENKLKIKSATLHCGDTSDKLSNNDKVDDLKPDTQNCYMEVEVENTFRSTSEISFDTIDVEIEIDHDEFTVFESSTIDGLEPDDFDSADTSDLEFDIDEDVPDKTYTMELRAYGYDYHEDTDETGAFHGVVWEIKLDVIRENYDIQIRSPKMTPAKMDCNGGTLKVDATLINLGKKDDDEVAAEVDIADLSLNVRKTGIDLDESDSTGVSFSINIPKNVKEGVYPVIFNTYFKGTAISNTHTFELVVEKCAVVAEPEAPADTTPNNATVITPVQPADQTVPSNAVPAAPRARVTTSDSNFTESNAYLWLMGGLVVLFAAIVVVLVVVFFVRKPTAK